jgi:hypothetical protein
VGQLLLLLHGLLLVLLLLWCHLAAVPAAARLTAGCVPSWQPSAARHSMGGQGANVAAQRSMLNIKQQGWLTHWSVDGTDVALKLLHALGPLQLLMQATTPDRQLQHCVMAHIIKVHPYAYICVTWCKVQSKDS